ncbi:MAG: hypothetical protein M1812_006325 [Candelaria pacifica]|nr:MAG: hypothetical protein M1812_006325 [Candelaria pacifica]
MPAGGFSQQTSSQPNYPPVSLHPEQPSLTATGSHPFPNNDHRLEPQPTHVVGSQGRRGILPSAPGRAAAVTAGVGNTAKNAAIPPKDAEGKFPCPHCNKTYLHAKHLKRHLLRHTGDRPYMCILCRDTFSRSDILKRHFQKCSLRRGNPTGASHLSHSQAHLKKSHPGPHKPPASTAGNSQPSNPTNGINNLGMTSFSPALGGQPSTAPRSAETLGGQDPGQNHLLGTDGMQRTDDSVSKSQREFPAHDPNRPHRGPLTESNDESSHAIPRVTDIPNTAFSMPPPSRYSQSFAYDPASSIHSFSKESDALAFKQTHPPNFVGPQMHQGNELDWSNLYIPNGHEGYGDNPMFPSQLAQAQMPIKSDPDLRIGPFGVVDDHNTHLLQGLYATPLALGTHGLPNTFSKWNFDLSGDPLQRKVDRLIAFCSFDSPGQSINNDHVSDELRELLTVDNVKHFVFERFTNFQGHWPLIHIPTFNLLEAYDGLVLAIICIGAIYSDRLTQAQVRTLMEHTRYSIERSSDLYSLVTGRTEAVESRSFGSRQDVDELQALTLLQILFIWHGDQSQRESARNDFATIYILAHKVGLLQPASPGNPAYSVLHQSLAAEEDPVADSWNWLAWIEQEKRSRLMFAIYLIDVALVLYFNIPPKFNAFEVRVPLPADDSSWDAEDRRECADSLGFSGPAAQYRNVTGSRLKRQPLFHHALKTLLEPAYSFQPRTTNVCSKFILVHALHVNIFKAQRMVTLGSGNYDFSSVGSGTTTPITDNPWITVDDNISSGLSNGQSTPNDVDHPHRLLKSTNQALAKWKKAWDDDMQQQYPPSAYKYRRFGFCRDGVHFYWLAIAFLRSNRASDWQAPADSRFMQVIKLLKKVKVWVATDNAQRGEEIGSVGDIDESYGVDALTLDMRRLFKPLNMEFDSPVSGVQTNIGKSLQ